MTEQYFKTGNNGWATVESVEVFPKNGVWYCERPEGFIRWVNGGIVIKFTEEIIFKRKYVHKFTEEINSKRKYSFIDEPFEVSAYN